jgi:hypothetical protein
MSLKSLESQGGKISLGFIQTLFTENVQVDIAKK